MEFEKVILWVPEDVATAAGPTLLPWLVDLDDPYPTRNYSDAMSGMRRVRAILERFPWKLLEAPV